MTSQRTLLGLLVLFVLVLVVVYENLLLHPVPNLEINGREARTTRFGLILDVRSPKEREQLGFYPRSIPISLDRIEKEIPASPDASILIYSNGDDRAKKAAIKLYHLGYHHVRYLPTTYLAMMPGSA